jgi:hypothetical protein
MANYIGHCRSCDYALFATTEELTNGENWTRLFAGEARRINPYGIYGRCNNRTDGQQHKAFKLQVVKGKFNPDHKCDTRCTNAKGSDCTCACGGANHGRGYAVQFQQASITEPRLMPATDSQLRYIQNLIQGREMPAENRTRAYEMLTAGLSLDQAKKWIDKLLTLPKK